MRRRPPAISLTRLTYSSAISLKTSLAPQEPCILSTIGDCATEIIGAANAAAPATPPAAVPRNRRRLLPVSAVDEVDAAFLSVIVSLLWSIRCLSHGQPHWPLTTGHLVCFVHPRPDRGHWQYL